MRKAILVDIDGTVALMGKGEPGRRGPYDWDRVGEDDPNLPIIGVVKLFRQARAWLMRSPHTPIPFTIIFVTGRKEQCREQTWWWLNRQGLISNSGDEDEFQLLMRPDNDNRGDEEVKADILVSQILPKFEVMFVLDDRDKVVRMWRDQGLTCLQVAEGNF